MEPEIRNLSFNNFLHERSQQLVKFSALLQAQTKKKGHQGLPKSIRRRAMSHNRFRVPLKLRKHLEKDLLENQSLQKLPKCRKHIRKRHHLVHDYIKRHKNTKWLANHLWASKRMKMIQSYGYKIALTPNDKCFRSSYRHYKHNCCLMNFSYLQCFRINKLHNQLPNNIKILQNLQVGKYVRGYIVGNKNQFVCPILLIQFCGQIFGFFHPSCLAEINQIQWQQKFQLSITQSPLDIYLLLGPESLKILKNVLEVQNFQTKQKDKWNMPNPYFFEHNELQYFMKTKKTINPITNLITHPSDQQIKLSYSPIDNLKLRKIALQQINILTKSNNKQQENGKQFFEYFKNMLSVLPYTEHNFSITTRSKYTHRRGNKLSKTQKKDFLKKKEERLIQKKEQNTKKQNIVKEIKIEVNLQLKKKLKSLEEFQHAMVGIINQPNLYQGCYLICSRNQNCKIWRQLTHQNVKVIGRRQYRQLMLESSQSVFPEDYFNSKSFFFQQQKKSEKYFLQIKRKPPQKRPNFIKINSPYPFTITHSDQHWNISLQMVSKGRCFEGSYIVQLNFEDYGKINQQLNQGVVGIVSSEKQTLLDGVKIDYSKMTKLQIDQELGKIKCSRNIIGFVSSGGFIFTHSKEGGIGFINKYIKTEYVLIRKPTSRHYYLASIKYLEHSLAY